MHTRIYNILKNKPCKKVRFYSKDDDVRNGEYVAKSDEAIKLRVLKFGLFLCSNTKGAELFTKVGRGEIRIFTFYLTVTSSIRLTTMEK